MPITIRPISIPDELNLFIKLQWKFYTNDLHWVPPLLHDKRKLLDPSKNPFFHHGEAQLYFAEKDGIPVGRIAAIVNTNHNDIHNDQTGFFGFFESVNDPEVANALFDAAANWLRTKGKDVMQGPMNPSINDEVGLLVHGFESPPVVLMPYNPKYYSSLCEGYGFRKAKDLYAYFLETHKVLTPKLERGQQIVRERYGLKIRNMDFKHIDRELHVIKEIYNSAWEKNWGAVAMTDAEFDALANDLVQILRNYKEFAIIAENKDHAVGFALAIPNINELLISNRRGWLLPAAYRLIMRSGKIKSLRILVLGLLSEYRGKGFDSVLYWELLQRGLRRNIRIAEASWVLEDNVMMNRAAKMLNAEAYKTYRIYEIPLS